MSAKDIVDILTEVINLIGPDTDVIRAGYDNVDEAIAELKEHISRIDNLDYSKLSDLKIMFAPTGAIQELALGGGWGDHYLELASRFDEAEKSIV